MSVRLFAGRMGRAACPARLQQGLIQVSCDWQLVPSLDESIEWSQGQRIDRLKRT